MRLHPALFCGWIACSTLSNALAQTQILASESKDPYSKRKEESLACLSGKFRVIGQEPGSGQTYTGSVSVIRQGDHLLVQRIINGEIVSGTGVILFELEAPVLEVAYRIGSKTVRAGYEFRCGDNNQPRASGWVYPAEGDSKRREQPGLEVWYYNRLLPAIAQNWDDSKGQRLDPDFNSFFEGKFRVIGEELGSGKVYTGTLTARVKGKTLQMKRVIDGQVSAGELIVNLSGSDRHSLTATFRVGKQPIRSRLTEQTVGDNYPRICGYFYPVDRSGKAIPTNSPLLETWFYDWR
jgi:hypothetical protein